MVRKILIVLIAAGALGFFVGSVIENELAYTLSGCVAVWTGFILAIQRRKAPSERGG